MRDVGVLGVIAVVVAGCPSASAPPAPVPGRPPPQEPPSPDAATDAARLPDAAMPAPQAIPPAARAALDELRAACRAADRRRVEQVTEGTVVIEAGDAPVPASRALAGPTVLPSIAAAIDAGCEIAPSDPGTVMCPPDEVIRRADPETGIFVIALRPDGRGAWRMYLALEGGP